MGKPKRNGSVVNYAQLNGDASDDEDFMDFSPTTTKRKEVSNKNLKSKRDKTAINEVKEPKIKEAASRRRSPRKRYSDESEQTYQEELERVLQISVTKNEKSPLKSIQNCTVPIEECVLKDEEEKEIVEVNSEMSDIENVIPSNFTSPSSKKLPPIFIKESPSPLEGTSAGFTAKRRRKKVNFKEADSDQDSSDAEMFTCNQSDSDDSVFSPSPKKRKERVTKSKRKSAPKSLNISNNTAVKNLDMDIKGSLAASLAPTQKLEMDLPFTSSLHSPKSKKFPLNLRTTLGSPQSENAQSDESAESFKGFGLSRLAPKVKDPAPKTVSKTSNSVPKNISNSVPKAISSSASKIVSTVDPKTISTSKSPINKTDNFGRSNSFKSPLVSQTASNKSNSPCVSASTGLRLGLSRRGFKPLHPKASLNDH